MNMDDTPLIRGGAIRYVLLQSPTKSRALLTLFVLKCYLYCCHLIRYLNIFIALNSD